MKNKTTIFVIIISLLLASIIYIEMNRYREYQSEKAEAIILKQATIEDIKKESDKINIYVFWGDGCPHCEELFEFLENIKSNYGKYYNVYGFEVWYEEENRKLMDQFKEELKEETGSRGVPYFIVGDESFLGYQSSMNQEIKDTIESKYKERKNVKQFEDILKKKDKEINK